jgi:hypothetical protein
VKGKTPLNLAVGLFAVTPRGVSSTLPLESSDRWKVQKTPARDILQNQLAAAAAPARVARTMTASATAGARVTTGDGNSAIVYDRTERRFVNAENPQSAKQGIAGVRVAPEQSRSGSATSRRGTGLGGSRKRPRRTATSSPQREVRFPRGCSSKASPACRVRKVRKSV